MPIILQQTVTACPLCGSANRALFDQRILHGYQLVNRLCQSCGLVYLSPRMSEEQLNLFYAKNYRDLYHQSKEPTQIDLSVQAQRATHLVDLALRQGLSTVKAHLDIGCSTGTLLNTFKTHYNNRTVGVELDEVHRAYAQSHGINAYPSLVDLPGELEKAFDLVSLIHVLEHLPDPVGTLVELRTRWMSPEGWLVLEVPNLYCHDSFEVAHLTSFSPATLTQAVRRAGFQIVHLFKHGQPRSIVLPLYLTLLARPMANPANSPYTTEPEMGVHLKRQVGLAYRKLLTRLIPGQAWKAG
jgi:2-polyprenyl-3-methyl-5-hydroxy-6-metoxy-1,4-benzoquinol methylase